MRLLWWDCETTGLDPRKDDMLEVAWATSALERPFEVSEVRVRLVDFRWAPWAWPERLREMHEKSGLIDALFEHPGAGEGSMESPSDVERRILEVVPEEADPEERTVIAGASVGPFDLQFIRHVMPTLASRLSHRAYDVSSAKLFCRSLGMPKLPKGDPAHRAKADVIVSVEHARLCAEWLDETGSREGGLLRHWRAF